MNKTLDDLRKEIDAIDDELLQILAKRIKLIREIGELKKEQNFPPLDEKRWKEVLQRVLQTARKHNLSEELIKKLYERIHQEALEIEKNV